MSEPIKQSYRDIEIVLLEDENVWQFTVNGRQRKAPTLPKAREYIDNALDRIETKKEKPWEPIDAYFLDLYPNSLGNLQKGKIMSVAGRDYRGRDEVWFSSEKAGRRKVSIASMVAVSDSNDEILVRLKKNEEEQDRLAEAFRRDAALLLRVELPKNGDGE